MKKILNKVRNLNHTLAAAVTVAARAAMLAK
jgi:hypothetical protein